MSNKINQTLTKSNLNIKCVICNIVQPHEEIKQTGLRKSFKVIVCPACGLRSVYPSPIDLSGGMHYKSSKGVANINKSGIKNLLRSVWITLRQRPVARQLVKRLSGGKILDIGAGDGTLIQRVKKKGKKNNYSFFALELSDSDYLFLRNLGINVQQSTLEEASFPENSFDAVLITHVFEHIPNIIEVLGEIKKILKPGGLLFASVPSESALSMKLGLKKCWMNLGIRGHIYSFNKFNFPMIISNSGFDIIVSEEKLFVPQVMVVASNRK